MQRISKKYQASQFLVAHRGYTAAYPENTLLAIQAALDAGALYIEIDIQLTKDKEVVLFHDRDLTRLCRVENAIYDYDLSELQSFSSYSPERFAEKFKGEKIPTLIEVVRLLEKYPNVTLFVELKRNCIEFFSVDTVVNTVLPLLSIIKHQCVVISFSIDAIEKVKQCSNYSIGVVIDNWTDVVTTHFKRLEVVNPNYLFCDIASLPKDKKIKLLNSIIAVYECADVDAASAVLQQGVSLVETFEIKNMINQLTPTLNKYNEL